MLHKNFSYTENGFSKTWLSSAAAGARVTKRAAGKVMCQEVM